MSEAEERLLTQMKELTPKRGYTWAECIPEEDLARAEAMLGFLLPSLLRRIYLEVGNGAFGLSPLYERVNDLAMPLVESYVGLRLESGGDENGERRWPEKLLIIYDHGCNIYSCLDCAHPEQRVLMNDNNKDLNTYALEAPSFQQWLQVLLEDTLYLHFDWDTAEKVAF
jgi:SMI1 / KNR4 family (SUKH-1)